jgi:hypothetical protein
MKRKFTAEKLTQARMKIQMIMMMHVGPGNKIGMGELYREVFGREYEHRINDTRQIRELITEMRSNGLPVMSDSSATRGGYWLASGSSEIQDWCNRNRYRALDILRRVATVKKISLQEYIGQLAMDLQPPDGKGGSV